MLNQETAHGVNALLSILFVCLFVNTKMTTLSEVGKHAMCTYHVRARNEKVAASTYLTSESVLRRARKQGSFYLFESSFYFSRPFPMTINTTSFIKHLGDRSSGHFTAFPAMYNSEMKRC